MELKRLSHVAPRIRSTSRQVDHSAVRLSIISCVDTGVWSGVLGGGGASSRQGGTCVDPHPPPPHWQLTSPSALYSQMETEQDKGTRNASIFICVDVNVMVLPVKVMIRSGLWSTMSTHTHKHTHTHTQPHLIPRSGRYPPPPPPHTHDTHMHTCHISKPICGKA